MKNKQLTQIGTLNKLIVEPNSNPKNGNIIVFPPLNISLIFESRLPKIKPRINGISKEKIWTILVNVSALWVLPNELIKTNRNIK